MSLTSKKQRYLNKIRTVVIVKNFNGPFCEKLLVSETKKVKKKKKKKDRDPTISAVTNIHTRFYMQIREYPSTRILAAALNKNMQIYPACKG